LRDLVVDSLGGGDKGLGSLVSKVLLGAAVLAANPAMRADRGDLSTATGPPIGDIVLYQARGQRIRDYIEKQILEHSKQSPVVIVAHSLGGIASLDLLITKDLWKHVRALVTVGSQGSYFYEIGALWSLEKTDTSTLPAHFPGKRWLNILNRWDFLSYEAEPVFPKHATDRVVTGLSPFPVSHSAYWKNPQTWQHVATFLNDSR
jgi:pimeloyl-ACP methyl ester carboxylesterase